MTSTPVARGEIRRIATASDGPAEILVRRAGGGRVTVANTGEVRAVPWTE
ncbi:hypothetical protein [Streptomyces sp. NBC_01803]|nr:hypothetical protein [Streptomyces sp. NBC_01803]WSA45259.1 hypothetical protein OIE51_14200 [Streptomyces sp. NBC_01803]